MPFIVSNPASRPVQGCPHEQLGAWVEWPGTGLSIATCEGCKTTISRPDPAVEGYEESDLEENPPEEVAPSSNPGERADDPEEYLEVLVDDVGGEVAWDPEKEEWQGLPSIKERMRSLPPIFGAKENPSDREFQYEDLDEEQQLLLDAVTGHWVDEGFYRGRAKIMPLLEEGAWVPFDPEDDDSWDTGAGEWVESMGPWKWLARAVIFTEYGTPKPYDPGAYYEKLDAALEPLGYKHYVINAAVVAIMVDPYSDEGEAILEEHDD